MSEFVIHPFSNAESRQPQALPEDSGFIRENVTPRAATMNAESAFIDEAVVRRMILDGSPDDLPRTGNPALPQNSGQVFPMHPLAFAG